MYKYEKHLPYPINITKKNLKMAKYMLTQFGGANSEMGAALRYFSQKFTMPDESGKALLNDIANEELGHIEMIAAMIKQLTDGATIDEVKNEGLGDYYSEHGIGIYPVNASGSPFTISFVGVTGDAIADLSEDMAAEQKARATYENLIKLADDDEVIQPLLFLRQREIVHFNRFKELYDKYKKMGY
jgi:spore coat protein JC